MDNVLIHYKDQKGNLTDLYIIENDFKDEIDIVITLDKRCPNLEQCDLKLKKCNFKHKYNIFYIEGDEVFEFPNCILENKLEDINHKNYKFSTNSEKILHHKNKYRQLKIENILKDNDE